MLTVLLLLSRADSASARRSSIPPLPRNVRQVSQILVQTDRTDHLHDVRRLCAGSVLCRIGPSSVLGPGALGAENAPEPSSATATPKRQRTEAIKTRRLKKADFEVDFFFIDGAELFPSAVNPRR